MRHSSSGTDSALQFYTKSIDIAYVGISPFLMARSYGVPIRTVGIASQFARSHAVIAKPGWDQRAVVRVATVWGSTAHLTAYQWSRDIGRPCSFINLGLKDMLPALESGFVDVIACWDPYGALAERRGYLRIFDGRHLANPSFNFICASDELIENHPRFVRAFVAAHRDGVASVLAADNAELADHLATVFESRLSSEDFAWLLRNHYVWPDSPFFEVPEPDHIVWPALDHAAEFLRHIGQLGIGTTDLASCFDHVPDEGSMPSQVTVGYSDSFMCVPFHASAATGTLANHGFQQDPATRLLAERIASCEPLLRHDLVEARALMRHNVDEAVIRIGEVHEAVIYELFLASVSTVKPTRVSGALTELERKQILPPRLIAGAHFIRALRNAAAFGDGSAIKLTEGERALAQLLDLVDFIRNTSTDSAGQCRRCASVLDLAWPACPVCGLPTQPTCPGCGGLVRNELSACPNCGHQLPGAEAVSG
jgi:ABC-type nitrate/sulfonate/bicarbonate transport system substrate-binding protein